MDDYEMDKHGTLDKLGIHVNRDFLWVSIMRKSPDDYVMYNCKRKVI